VRTLSLGLDLFFFFFVVEDGARDSPLSLERSMGREYELSGFHILRVELQLLDDRVVLLLVPLTPHFWGCRVEDVHAWPVHAFQLGALTDRGGAVSSPGRIILNGACVIYGVPVTSCSLAGIRILTRGLVVEVRVAASAGTGFGRPVLKVRCECSVT
jgi:hypothetical protein